MAAGLPIAAFLHSASDAHSLIAQAHCGVSAHSGDLNACVDAMRYLIADEPNFYKIGLSGKRFAQANFSKEVCVDQIEQLIT
jgi:glycosyltransferase involved in cell wall biosynthesis